MPIQISLTNAEQTALNGPVALKTYLSFIPRGTALATATVFVDALDPTDTILTTSESANWTSVKKGMMLVVMDSTSTTVKTVTRVRIDIPSVGGVNVHNMALADPGLLPQDIRNASIVAGDKIYIYGQTFAPWVIPSRIFFSGGLSVFYKDFDLVYTDQNSLPPPILKMNIYKPNGSNPDIYLGNHAAVFVDDGQSYATVKLKVDYTLWPTSSSITSYTGTLPGSTVTSGSLNSNAATVQLSKGTYLWTMTIADNNSKTTLGYRLIRVHDSTDMPLSIAAVSSDVRDQAGRRVTLQLNDNVLSNIPDGSMCILWNEVWVNDVKFGVPTMTTQFVGWLFRTEPSGESGLRQANCEIVGPQGLMAKMGNVSQYMEVKSVPATWAEFISDLANIRYLIFYLLKNHAGNILDLFDLNFDTTSNLTGRRTTQSIAAGALYDQCSKLAKTIKCNFGCDSSGSIYVQPIPPLRAYTDRSGIIQRDSLTASKAKNYTLPRRHRPELGLLYGQGFYSNGIKDFPVKANAPGGVRSQGLGEDQAFYTVDNQNDLDTTIGMEWAIRNSLFDDGNCLIEQNRDVYEPAQMPFIPQTIPAYADPYGLGFTKNTIIKSVSKIYYTQGYADLALTWSVETSGLNVPTILIPPVPTAQPTPPAASTINNGTYKHNGSSVIAHDATHIGLGNYYTSSSKWLAGPMSGLSGTLLQLRLNPFAPFLITKTGALPAYMLTTNGLYYITDILDPAQTWTHQQTFTVDVGFPDLVMFNLRPSSNISGNVYVSYWDGSHTVASLYSGHGSTLVETQNFTTVGVFGTGDIDNYGSDEMLVGPRLGSYVSGIFRMLNGATPVQIVSTFTGSVRFIQKPLLKFDGTPNSSVDGSECFIFVTGDLGGAGNSFRLYKYNAGVLTDISPTAGNSVFASSPCSIIFTTNPNVMIVYCNDGKIRKTQDGGATWSVGAIITTDLTSQVWGYYPTVVGGTYATYWGGTQGMGYSSDFGDTMINATGDWVSTIGAISGGFRSVIPLY